MTEGVHVSSAKIYESVLSIENALTRLITSVEKLSESVRDHESRIREIETREDLSRRVVQIEETMKTIQQRVWAFPSLATIGAAVAIVVALAERA